MGVRGLVFANAGVKIRVCIVSKTVYEKRSFLFNKRAIKRILDRYLY